MNPLTGEIVKLSVDQEARLQHEQLQGNGHIRRVLEKENLVELSDSEVEILTPLSLEKRKGWMRNHPCVCGSGVKFKRCCWGKFK